MKKRKEILVAILAAFMFWGAYVTVMAQEQPAVQPEKKQVEISEEQEDASAALWKYQLTDKVITDLQEAGSQEIVQADIEKWLEESFSELEKIVEKGESGESLTEEEIKKLETYEEELNSRCDFDFSPLFADLDSLIRAKEEPEITAAREKIRQCVYTIYKFPQKEEAEMPPEVLPENPLDILPQQDLKAPQLIEEGIYLFRTAKDEDRILEVEGASLEDGGRVQIYDEASSDSQKWRVIYVGDFYYKLINVNSGKALETVAGQDGLLQQAEDTGNVTQLWRFYQEEGGAYSIVSKEGIRIDTRRDKSFARSRTVELGWYLEQFAAVTGGRYYHTLADAVNQCADGAEILITGSHTSRETDLPYGGDKSYSVLPSGGSYTVRYAESSREASAMIRPPDGGGKASTVINLRGNGAWTLTLDGNNCGSSALVGLGYGTLNVYPGVTIMNSKTNGIFNNYGVTNIYGGTITQNRHAGVASIDGTINIYGGSINKNATDGARAHIVNMKAGTVERNGNNGISTQAVCASNQLNFWGGTVTGNQNHGIYLASNNKSIVCTFSGGIVNGNGQSGIYNNNGTVTVSGGAITGNGMSGIQNYGTLSLKGGDISGNRAPKGSGIYQDGTMYMNGPALVNANNDIYLPVGRFVTVNGGLTQTAKTVAKLTPADYFNGRRVMEVAYGSRKASGEYTYSNGVEKFSLSPRGTYLLRPGDYLEDKAGTPDNHLIISSRYQIEYHKNINAAVSNMPPVQTKYWNERIKLSEMIPSIGAIRFQGWHIDPKAGAGIYQPGSAISMNQHLTLYAVWQTKLKVTYAGNGADSGTEKSEYTTMQECGEKGGYTIRKNAAYTSYKKNGYTFQGWNDNSVRPSEKTVKYPEKITNKRSFEELLVLAKEDSKGIPEVVLSGAWDKTPEIKASEVLVFYEGTEVSKKMLLSNVTAADLEDGNITNAIRITGIDYADGKLVEGEKQPGVTEKWQNDMPENFSLDTWFLQLDKADSPLTHMITYAVTDSAGNETTLEWKIQVKYNEFPVIEAVDRYFTLEEAQSGAITSEELLKNAFAGGKLKVTDIEEDMLYPGTIQGKTELLDFRPEEFIGFQESGYVVLTYSAKDSMGKEGIGKETTCQFTVHVRKDGEIVEPPSAKYVRFINEENYLKNISSSQDISDAEKEALNKNGGLHVESKWYRDPEYKKAISALWDETAAPEAIWTFSPEQVQQVKAYVERHGIGNSKDADALAGFAAVFGSQKK